MMKTNELMIGDWFRFRYTIDGREKVKTFRISQIENELGEYYVWGNGFGRMCFPERLEPIPLTPEILEKNGFKMAKWKEDEPVGLLGEWWDNRGQVLVKRFDFTLLGEVYSVKANNSRISNIRYVHDLQHALRICGIEKEIVI